MDFKGKAWYNNSNYKSEKEIGMLEFKKIEISDLDIIKKYMKRQPFRACDFTIFGIFLWADYYNYTYCVYEDTFFLKGRSDGKICDFAVPFGSLNTKTAIGYIKDYCNENNITPRFYFVPEPALDFFENANVKQMVGWSDYVYSAEAMKTLKGKRFSKKRNRLNKFSKKCKFKIGHKCRFESITPENINRAREFFGEYLSEYKKDDPHFKVESELIYRAFDIFFELEQTGGILLVDEKVVAMTIGEAIGDTLYVHVEKALRQYEGAYEAINHAYANKYATESIKYINREEDMGDEGLRQAKRAYNPVFMINKYEIFLD